MTIHKVKSWKHIFNATALGLKTSDIRYIKERDYKINDIMILQETEVGGDPYTGRELPVIITHIISKHSPCALSFDVLMEEACILSIQKVGEVMDKNWWSEFFYNEKYLTTYEDENVKFVYK